MDIKGQEVKYFKKDDLEKIRNYLKEKDKTVFLSFINIGVNVGLRISDLGKLKFEDIKNDFTLLIKEKKTGKFRTITLNKICKRSILELKLYYQEKGYDIEKGYLFKSLSPYNLKNRLDTPYLTNAVSQHFRKLRHILNIPYAIGTHSLRKTWGNRVYMATKDISLLMKAFGHSSVEQTLKYIGIDEEKIKALYNIEI